MMAVAGGGGVAAACCPGPWSGTEQAPVRVSQSRALDMVGGAVGCAQAARPKAVRRAVVMGTCRMPVALRGKDPGA